MRPYFQMDNNLHPVRDYLSKVGDTGAHCVPCGEAASSGPWVRVTGQGRKRRLREIKSLAYMVIGGLLMLCYE